MDFKTPPRGYYVDYQPRRPQPQQPAPPPKPEPEAPKEEKPEKPKKNKKKKAKKTLKWLIPAAILLFLVAVMIWLTHGYITTRNQLEAAKNSKSAPTTGSQEIINKVGLLVDLPQGETPTVATVNDASKLKNQQFFARAKNGDRVLIYAKSGMAVLYRPSTNRVIEYSKVNINTSSQQ